MKIYLAATAPGNESKRKRGMLDIPKRLLSYYSIITPKTFETDEVFNCIKYENLSYCPRTKKSKNM